MKPLKNVLALNVRNDPEFLGVLRGNLQGYNCPRCHKNDGIIFIDRSGPMFFCSDDDCLREDNLTSASMKNSEQIRKEKDSAELFSLGTRYAGASLIKWMASEHNKTKVINWMKNLENFLVLVGTPGTGKTYFCAALGNYLLDQKKEVRYTHTRDFLGAVKKTFDDPGKNPLEYIRALSQLPILILDDVGSTLNTEWQIENILALLDFRYSNNRPTIITTNLTSDLMKELLGERISRRVFSPDSTMVYTNDEY